MKMPQLDQMAGEDSYYAHLVGKTVGCTDKDFGFHKQAVGFHKQAVGFHK